MRRLQRAWACFQRYVYDRLGVRLRLKVRLLKAEVIETLLYGCMTWSPNKPDYDRLPRVHHSMLLRCLGWRKRKRDDHTLSYADVLAKTASESIEAIVRKTEDIVCGIRSTYGGGASATEGDVWGACWGKGLRRGAREGLVGASEGGYVGLWNEIHASECDNNNLYARRRASGLV